LIASSCGPLVLIVRNLPQHTGFPKNWRVKNAVPCG